MSTSSADPKSYHLQNDTDIVVARRLVREMASRLGFTLVDQTKIVTAASELARNTVVHGRGGTMRLEEVSNGPKRGLRIYFRDHGPGIPDVDQAMTDGFTTEGGLGLGLGGTKRLVNEFEVKTGEDGTEVTITRWK